MLLAEELALIAIDPDSGHHALGTRSQLNACLAGLLVAELALDDRPADSRLLTAASEVLGEKGPKLKPVLSHMDRGLQHKLGAGTWDSVVAGLVDAGLLGRPEGSVRPRYAVLSPEVHNATVERLRTAAACDDPVDARTAALLSMTGPAQLLELVAPDRHTRKHARRRIDHVLDSSSLGGVADSVRKVLAEAAAAAAVVATVAVVSTGN